MTRNSNGIAMIVTAHYTDNMLPEPNGERPSAKASGRVDPREGVATPSQPGDASASSARALVEFEALLCLFRINPSSTAEGR